MREEVVKWLKQAEMNLKAAGEALKDKLLFVTAFYSHQTAEAALKALWIYKKKELQPKTHNLIYLGRELNLPQDLLDCCILLNREYTVSRYPDAANGFPFEQYTEEFAQKCLEMAKKILEYVKNELQ